jgi:hypothetical protein
MNVEFVGESERHEHYRVGSYMFELSIHSEPEELREISATFSAWAAFVNDVAEIHAQ